MKLKLIDEDGEGPDEDQWDGYPAERAALLERLEGIDDVVVLSGDIHISAVGRVTDGAGAVPELTTPSLTSQNLDEKLGVGQRADEILAAEREFLAANDQFDWCEMASHGYVVVDLDRERLRAEWQHVDGVLERSSTESVAAVYEVERGSGAIRPAA